MRRQRVASASRNRHGLTPDEVEYLLARQERRCLICYRPLGADWVIDHDHVLAQAHGHTGAIGCKRCVRGILDRRCNNLLGGANDDPAILRRAAAYIDEARRNHR